MEFLHTQSRYNGSSVSENSSAEMRKNVGLVLMLNDKLLKKAHIVFSTRNLTKSITEITKTPPRPDSGPNNNPTIGTLRKPLERPCLLSSHGLCRGHPGSLKPGRFQHTLNLLPLTVCTEHGKAGFLPLDYVRRMGEYTRTTCRYPILKVVHSFDDCILEFPHPPPIGSSDSKLDCSRNCYECFADLSHRRTVYMYRDYLFCCHGCRLKACVARYWYKKAMKMKSIC